MQHDHRRHAGSQDQPPGNLPSLRSHHATFQAVFFVRIIRTLAFLLIHLTDSTCSLGVTSSRKPSLASPSSQTHLDLSLSSVQFRRSVVSDSVTPWTAACQASLSITNSWSLLKLMSIESVMPSNQLILKEISPEHSLETLMLKLKLQYFGHLM